MFLPLSSTMLLSGFLDLLMVHILAPLVWLDDFIVERLHNTTPVPNTSHETYQTLNPLHIHDQTMIPTNPLSGENSPSACSTDSDTDFIERQCYARQQLTQSDTEDTTRQTQSSPSGDGDLKQAVPESSIWEMPSYDRTRSESVLSQMHDLPMLPREEPQADDFIPQMPLLYLFINTKRHVLSTPSNSLSSTSSGDEILLGNITPKVPRVLIPKVHHPTEVMGTIIHCPGSISTRKVSRFHHLAVSSLEAAFHFEDRQPHIPALIGLPLWMRQHNKNDSIDEENEMVRQLWISANFDDPGFGTSPSQIGSKLVMRKDGVNLIPHHLEALCHFCLYVLQESCGDTGTLSSKPCKCKKQKKAFKKMATMRGFEEFWREYRFERASHDERWKDLPSPYDTRKLGMRYSWLAPIVNDTTGGETPLREADTVKETTRTEGLVTRGLARKREVVSEADRRGRTRTRESSEASSERSDISTPAKRRRTSCSGKSVTRESIRSNMEN